MNDVLEKPDFANDMRALALNAPDDLEPLPEARTPRRGQIALALKESGHAPEKNVLFGLWEWGVQ